MFGHEKVPNEEREFRIIAEFLKSKSGRKFIEDGGELICNCGEKLTNREQINQHINLGLDYYSQLASLPARKFRFE